MLQRLKPNFAFLVGDLLGSEGPVFSATGQFYSVAPEVEISGKSAGQILRVDVPSKKYELLCSPCVDGHGGIPAGCQCDKQGNLWVADMRLGILHINTTDGHCKQICAKDSEGRTMQGCNDCAFDYNGDLWVTAPAGSIAPEPYKRSFEAPFGSVYCYTKAGEVLRIDTGYWFCNGIAVKHSADGKPELLIVAETGTKSLWAYDIVGPGKVENKRKWATVPGTHEGGPDGMDFDIEGNLLVANWGSGHIEVFGPDGGDPSCRIECPFQRVSNLHFKPNSKEVYVTEHDKNAIWMFEWHCVGKPQFCEV